MCSSQKFTTISATCKLRNFSKCWLNKIFRHKFCVSKNLKSNEEIAQNEANEKLAQQQLLLATATTVYTERNYAENNFDDNHKLTLCHLQTQAGSFYWNARGSYNFYYC